MRKILGSLLVAILTFADVNVTLSKTTLFVKEPLLVQLQYSDKEYEKLAWVKFAPKRSQDYEFYLLGKQIKDGRYTFTYLLFPVKSGQVSISYTLQYKKAAIEQIRRDILGTGYEQTEPLEGKVVTLEPQSSTIAVKPVKKVNLYGDFHLRIRVDKRSIKSYEPLYVSVSLQGIGYVPKVDNLLQVDGVKVLADKPQKKISFTPKGAKIDYRFNYAIVADSNFTIPSIKLTEFNYEKYKILSTAPVPIKVVAVKLVDAKDEPPKIEPTIHKMGAFFIYAAIFLAGILSGVLLYLLLRKKEIEDIVVADRKKLLALLVLRYPHCFKDVRAMLQNNANLLRAKWLIVKGLRKCKK